MVFALGRALGVPGAAGGSVPSTVGDAVVTAIANAQDLRYQERNERINRDIALRMKKVLEAQGFAVKGYMGLGDPAGIGPEIAVKAALDPAVRAICRPVVFGSRAVFERQGLELRDAEVVDIPFQGTLEMGQIRADHGRAIIACAEAAIRAALAGEFDAVVAAPHTEAAIHAAGIAFDGYPSFVARTCGLPPEDGILMLCFEHAGREVRIAHVTLHVSVSNAIGMITKERVLRTLRAVHKALGNPRIGVSGVNPHASEIDHEAHAVLRGTAAELLPRLLAA